MNNIIEQYDLFIFDLDDTIVKTEHIHYKSWLLALECVLGYKYYISHNDFYSIFHSKHQNSIKDYLKNTHNMELEEIIKKKDKIYLDLIHECKDEIKMVEGCEEFIKKIIENNKKFIIVSNTLKEKIIFFSDLFPILKKSEKNYYRELYKIKKPNPECYLKVLEDFTSEKKIGFEDSITGIHAMSQVPEITAYYINSNNYIHHNFILENYKVTHINNYKELL